MPTAGCHAPTPSRRPAEPVRFRGVRPIPVDETRPVLATDPRWTSDGVELELESGVDELLGHTGAVVCTLLLFVGA
jgi:hypothetical protein